MPEIHCPECSAWSVEVRDIKLNREQMLAAADRGREHLAALVRGLEFDLRMAIGLAGAFRHAMNAEQLLVLTVIEARLLNAGSERVRSAQQSVTETVRILREKLDRDAVMPKAKDQPTGASSTRAASPCSIPPPPEPPQNIIVNEGKPFPTRLESNPKADVAPASGAHVQRVVGCESTEKKP